MMPPDFDFKSLVLRVDKGPTHAALFTVASRKSLHVGATTAVRRSIPVYCKVMFCRVCGFRVRVWESDRTSRTFRHGYESATELPKVPGIVARACIAHRSSGRIQKVLYPYPGYCGTGCTELTDVPGTGINVLQNQQKFGYGYESLTELPEVPGIVARAHRTYRQKFRVRV